MLINSGWGRRPRQPVAVCRRRSSSRAAAGGCYCCVVVVYFLNPGALADALAPSCVRRSSRRFAAHAPPEPFTGGHGEYPPPTITSPRTPPILTRLFGPWCPARSACAAGTCRPLWCRRPRLSVLGAPPPYPFAHTHVCRRTSTPMHQGAVAPVAAVPDPASTVQLTPACPFNVGFCSAAGFQYIKGGAFSPNDNAESADVGAEPAPRHSSPVLDGVGDSRACRHPAMTVRFPRRPR